MQKTIPNIEFYQGLPTATFIDQWSSENEPQILVLDDLMDSVCSSADMVQLYTVKCHHRNITTITIQHSLYPPGKHSHTLSLNVNYFIIFKNYRDQQQIGYFAKQIIGDKSHYFMQSYAMATKQQYCYILIDLHPQSDQKYRLRSNILEGQTLVVYVSKV
jgi:hypothetical protein